MPITIGSNIASLGAQRRLSESTSQLSKTFERLSSGQRINKAADDAAGLAIAESLRSDSRVFNQGIRNFNDGLSLLNIADSAVDSLSNIVVRLKELAEQSANGTYSLKQRNALDKEAQALSNEYSRIAQTTKFNNLDLFGGELSGIRLQGGFGVDGSILAGVGGAIGSGSFNATASIALSNSNMIITGDFNGDGNQDFVSSVYTSGLAVYLGSGNGSFTAGNITLAGSTSLAVASGDFNGDGVLDLVSGNYEDTFSITLGRGDGTFQLVQSFGTPGANQGKIAAGDFNGDGYADIVYQDGATGNTALALGRGDGTVRFAGTFNTLHGAVTKGDFNGDGIEDLVSGNQILFGNASSGFQLGGTASTLITGAGDLNQDGKADLIGRVSGGRVTAYINDGNGSFTSTRTFATTATAGSLVSLADLNGDNNLDLLIQDNAGVIAAFGKGDGTFDSAMSLGFSAGLSTAFADFNNDGVMDIANTPLDNHVRIFTNITTEGVSALLPFSLSSMSNARQALSLFDKKIQQLASQRGKIGAFQSRIEVGINNLYSSALNYSAAEGRIRNADIAEESSQLTRLTILQQAASSVLAQTNIQPQLALKLLSP